MLLLLVAAAVGLVRPIAPHPRLRLTQDALAAMRAKIAADPLAASVVAQLREHGDGLLGAPLVNCRYKTPPPSAKAGPTNNITRFGVGISPRISGWNCGVVRGTASPSQALFPIPPNYNSPLCGSWYSRVEQLVVGFPSSYT